MKITLGFHEACDLLSRVTCKPGWTLGLIDSRTSSWTSTGGYSRAPRDQRWELVVRYHVPSAPTYAHTGEQKLTEIVHRHQVPLMREVTEDDFLRFVRDAIRNLEIHEVDEFIRLDGHCITNPHPEIGDLP